MSLDAMKQALAVLEEVADEVFSPYDNKVGDAILALRAAIEEAEKPHQWQGLTEEEINRFSRWAHPDIIETIEATLKEKNT